MDGVVGALDVGEELAVVAAVVALAVVDVVAAVVEANVVWTNVGVVVETALVVFTKHEQPDITAV